MVAPFLFYLTARLVGREGIDMGGKWTAWFNKYLQDVNCGVEGMVSTGTRGMSIVGNAAAKPFFLFGVL